MRAVPEYYAREEVWTQESRARGDVLRAQARGQSATR